MNQIDRLIAKAKKLGLGNGDVFLISGETGIWKVGDKEFPDFESAEQYVDTLLAGSGEDCTVIINDITPEYLKSMEKQIKEADRKRDREEMRRRKKEERKRRKKEQQERERSRKEKELLEQEHREQERMERESLLEIDEGIQLI